MHHETLDQKPAIQTIAFGTGICALGLAFVAATSQGICAILLGSNEKALAGQLRSIFPHAILRKAGKEFEATTDGTKDTDVHLFVYDATGKELGTDESPGPKCLVRVTPELDGKYRFLITNAGGDNSVTFKVNIAE